MRLFRLLLITGLLWSLVLGVQAQSPPRASVVAFGLWDEQRVFQLEAARGGAILARAVGAGPRTIIRANSLSQPRATKQSLASSLQAMSRRMDLKRDVLVLFLSSHGSPDGIAIKTARRVALLTPDDLAHMLAASGIKHRVVIVSACFSGIFADRLADANTLVITAADANHPSFGCTNTATWTYFGQAFFAEALGRTRSLTEAFAIAKLSIAKRELAEGFAASNPQIRGGDAVLPLLERQGR